jgi:hypothetical protein
MGMKSDLNFAFFVVIITTLFSCAYTPPIKGPEGDKSILSIASLEKIELNGVEQWILIRGEDVSKPVLLFLHGGISEARANPTRARFRKSR